MQTYYSTEIVEAVQWDATKTTWDEIMSKIDFKRWSPGELGSESFNIVGPEGEWDNVKKTVWIIFYPNNKIELISDFDFQKKFKSVVDKPTIEIDVDRYNELIDAEDMLSSLQGAGVDNWQGYEDAMEIYNDIKSNTE